MQAVGCGFLFKKVSGVLYKPVECKSDRISGVEIVIDKQPVLRILGVYLPYESHN